jgi:prephenate dehydrogenase/chorismate mutase
LARKLSEHQKLAEYREQIREITTSILDLANARQRLSLKIAASKRSLGLEIEDKGVESKLVYWAKQYAKEIGLDEELALSIVSELMRSSKTIQRRDSYTSSIRSHLISNGISKVSVIGAGRMGSWFAKYFQNLDVRVVLFDRNHQKGRSKAKEIGCEYAGTYSLAAGSDLAVVAVPITRTRKEIQRLMDSAGSGKILKIIEISSVKDNIAKAGLLEEKTLPANVALYSVHPLFGPSSNIFSENSIIQVNRFDSDFVQKLFPSFKLFKLGWKDHDALMGVLLSAPHALALMFADIYARHAKQIPVGITSPSYDHMLELASKVLHENPDVYFEIQSKNPYSKRTLEEMRISLKKFEKLLRTRSQFEKSFKASARALP